MFQGTALGAWEPLDGRRILLTFVQTLTDANGVYLGLISVVGHPEVSADGQTFTDNTPDARLMQRDADNNVVSDVVVAAGVSAFRIRPGVPAFPEATPTAGTPTG